MIWGRRKVEDLSWKYRLYNDLHQPMQGHFIIVTGYKGGVGVTTIAINLAMALGELTNNKVALIDLGRPFPDIAKFLDQEVTYSLSDIIEHGGSFDISFLQKIMQPYGPKLDILNGCNDIMDQCCLETDLVGHIFNSLRHMYHYIVVDLSQAFDRLFVNVIKQGDMVIMLSGLTIADLKNLKTIWPLLTEWAGEGDKLKLLINRLNKGNSIQLKSLERITKSPPFESLPSDYHLLMDALVQGAPLGVSAPRSKLWEGIKNLAQKIHQQLEPGSEEVNGKNVADTPAKSQHWFLPQGNRPIILGTFVLSILVLMFSLLNSFGTQEKLSHPLPAISEKEAPTVPSGRRGEKVQPGDQAFLAPGKEIRNEESSLPGLAPQAGQPRDKVKPSDLTIALSAEKTAGSMGSSVPSTPASGSQKTAEVHSSGASLAPAPEAKGEPKYVGSVTSNKYHYPECKWAKTILPERVLGFKSIAEAKTKGYIPCPTCKPPLGD
jgi:MinD-like ATPase involved in chromosome partitioning or flagellar assembly